MPYLYIALCDLYNKDLSNFRKLRWKFVHHRISIMKLGHLLTRSGLTYPEVSSKVGHDSFCQLGNNV